jgi:hypothetical protein
MHNCVVCHLAGVETLIDFGPQALSNRFLSSAREQEVRFPFALGQCPSCGVMQFLQAIGPEELKPRFDWISYREPERHLDGLVQRICELPGITPASAIAGVSFKDDSTLERFRARGFTRIWRLDPREDLGVDDRRAGLETITARLSRATAEHAVGRHGPADVLVARHILEHSPTPGQFLIATRTLLKTPGYLVLEVPDCSPAVQHGDYTMTWEEHILYFTPATFRQCLATWDLSLIHCACHDYGHENSLVTIVQAGCRKRETVDGAALKASLRSGREYADAWPQVRDRVRQMLSQRTREQGPVAVFGAGHLSCAWINYLGLDRFLAFVVDDHPDKQGLFMPGSRLSIRGTSELQHQGIKLCLTGLNAASEATVAAANQAYLVNGGAFASIFPGRQNSFTM